jgi:hypothetical protein
MICSSWLSEMVSRDRVSQRSPKEAARPARECPTKAHPAHRALAFRQHGVNPTVFLLARCNFLELQVQLHDRNIPLAAYLNVAEGRRLGFPRLLHISFAGLFMLAEMLLLEL